MTKIEESVVIRAPLGKVFTFTNDWRNLKRYFLYVQDITPMTEKTIGVGARFSLRVKFLGRMMISNWECIELLEGVGWTFNTTLMGVTAIKRWHFALEENSTRVTFTMEYKPFSPLIGNVLDVILIRPEWKRIYKQAFTDLKRLIEAEVALSLSSSPA